MHMEPNNEGIEALWKQLEEMQAWREEQERRDREAQLPPLYQMLGCPIEQFQRGAWGPRVQQGDYQVGFYQGGNSYVQQGGYQAYNPNLSYGNPTNAQCLSAGFSASNGVIEEPKKNTPSMEQMMQQLLAQQDTFINQTGQMIGALESTVSSLAKQVEMMEGQISQMANQFTTQHTPDKFPSNTEVNPREQYNAIMLRSGKGYENHVSLGKDKEKVLVEGIPYEESSTHEEEGLEEVQQEIAQKKVFIESPLPTKDMIIKAPFPHHLDEPSYEESKLITTVPTSLPIDSIEHFIPKSLCSYPDLGDARDEVNYPSIFKPGYKYYCFDVP